MQAASARISPVSADSFGDRSAFAGRQSGLNFRATFVAVIVPLLITRLLLTVIGLSSLHFLPDQVQSDCRNLSSHPGINIWSHWDARWYLSIAQRGYSFSADQQSNVAFAPLYPLLICALAWPFGLSNDACLLGGLLISNVSLLIGLIFVYRLAAERFDRACASRAVVYILVCPGTLYLSAVYPMSLFLAISASAIYFAQRRKWLLAIGIACLAPLTRPDGALLIVPLAIELFYQQHWHLRAFLSRAWILAVLLLASCLWPAYLLYRFDDPLVFIRAQSGWNASPFWTVFHSQRAWLFLGTAFVFAILTLASWWKLRPTQAAYASTLLLMMLSAARFWSIVRFLVILFPAFIVLALAGRSKIPHVLYIVASSVIAGCLMVRFALGFWVA